MMQCDVGDATETLGVRLQKKLRKRYSVHAAKQVARLTGADLRTARSWVEEAKVPQEHHLRAIIRELGKDALLALFGPEIETHTEKLERQLNDLREEAARIEARIEESRSSASFKTAQGPGQGACDPHINHDPHRRGYGPDGHPYRRRADDR